MSIQTITIMSHVGEVKDGRLAFFFCKNMDALLFFQEREGGEIQIWFEAGENISKEFISKELDSIKKSLQIVLRFYEPPFVWRSISPRKSNFLLLDPPHFWVTTSSIDHGEEIVNKTPQTSGFLSIIENNIGKIILMLEWDCTVKSTFFEKIKKDINEVPEEWLVIGSYYHGRHNLRKKKSYGHYNGVAVHNCCELYILEAVKSFKKRPSSWSHHYDSGLHAESKLFKDRSRGGLCHSTDLILNICTPEDVNLDAKKIKPAALLIHQKPTVAGIFDYFTKNLKNPLDNDDNYDITAREE